MIEFLNKFRIPTILGLGIIVAGMVGGVYLVLQNQTFSSQAAPSAVAQNITFTNISEDSAVVSWQTASPVNSFITFGQNNPTEQTALDDRDTTTPQSHLIHLVTLKNLFPKTTYQLKIISGKKASDILKFTTASPPTTQTGFTPIIGSILDNNQTISEGVVYLSIEGAYPQSGPVKSGGSFLIPLSYIRKEDLSDTYPLTPDTLAKLTIITDQGQATALINLKTAQNPLPPIKLGENVDLTIQETPSPSPTTNLDKYDLNKDGKINSADYALVTKNKVDLNGDGIFNQKDLDLMSKQINQ